MTHAFADYSWLGALGCNLLVYSVVLAHCVRNVLDR
jgi:hypothetical protein